MQYTSHQPANTPSAFSTFPTSRSLLSMLSFPARLALLFHSFISRTSCLYPAIGVFPLQKSSLLPPSLKASLAHAAFFLRLRTSSSHPRTQLRIQKQHCCFPFQTKHTSLSPHCSNAVSFPSSTLPRHQASISPSVPQLPRTVPFTSTASEHVCQPFSSTLLPQESRLAVLEMKRLSSQRL